MSENEELQTFKVTEKEYDALNLIRGLDQNAFYMVVLAKPAPDGGYILTGSEETFAALERDLFDEIDAQLSPPTRLRQIAKVYHRLTPDCGDF
jgi:hypothetical protein